MHPRFTPDSTTVTPDRLNHQGDPWRRRTHRRRRGPHKSPTGFLLRAGRELIYTQWVRHASITTCYAAALLLAGCSDSTSVRVCFGSTSFCEQVLQSNVAPVADAGGPQEAIPGETVLLDGSASRDSDGYIVSYSWAQTDGDTVVLRNADQSIAEFDAPRATVTRTLTFQLTVVDDGRLADRDDTTVTISPAATAAAARGIGLLERTLLPGPLLPVAPCPLRKDLSPIGRSAFAGLWLSVHASRLGSTDVADYDAVSGFLDGARILVSDARHLGTDLDAPFVHHGLSVLAAFSEERDPALADRARQLLARRGSTGAANRLLAGRLRVSLADDGSIQLEETQPVDARTAAIKQLLDSNCEQPMDPLGLAAHTLVLLAGGH